MKAFIYLVVDTFSRKILSWAVDSTVRASTHIATVTEAWDRFITPHGDGADVPTLITDGYQSLYLRDIANIQALQTHLERWIPVYNDERPHCAHGYLTPTEVHEGAIPVTGRFALQFEEARKARIMANRAVPCPICPPTERTP